MRVRRGAARLATVFGVLAALVAVGASPAAADSDRVSVQVPNTFVAGGSAGSVTVSVAKRTPGCVAVRTVLSIRLDGLSADQVRVEVATGGKWHPVSVSGGGDGVVTQRTAPEKPVLCDRKSVAVRYRLTFLAGAPNDEAVLVGEAFGNGASIDRDTDTAELVARKGASPTPRRSATASPTPEETAAVPPVESPATPAAAVPQSGQGGQAEDGGFFGLGSVVMLLGIGMVGIGIALLVLLLRRGRGDGGVDPVGDDYPVGAPASGRVYSSAGQAGGGYPAIDPAGGRYPGMDPQGGGYPVDRPLSPPPPPPPAASGSDATAIMPKFPY